MAIWNQGDIVYADLAPTRGVEATKTRPCLIVSNNQYNHLLNTVIIIPISSSPKYQLQKFQISPLYIDIPENNYVKGTLLLQHVRAIDPKTRITSPTICKLDPQTLQLVLSTIESFFIE
jgi:Growth inhibitor